MPLAVSEEHEQLRRSARRWLDTYCPASVARATLDTAGAELPPVWKGLGDQGWLGLHVAEIDGGQGFGVSELAVVLEELAFSMAPGPVLSTVLLSAVLRRGSEDQRERWLRGLAEGATPGALYLGSQALQVLASTPEGLVVSGLHPVPRGRARP
jgi:alkylation response protein AidB-like acyl-CoA dehydrogenase